MNSLRAALYRRVGRTGAIAAASATPWIVALASPARSLCAQGVSTTSITGRVRSAAGQSIDDARVEVVNRASGYSLSTAARDGRFFALGLEVGGPYSVTVRRLGFAPATRDSLYLTLGESRSLDIVLQPAAQALAGVRVVPAPEARTPAQPGAGTTISDSLLHRLPSLNRDMYDFVRLTPQVSTRFGGLAGGAGTRLNSFLIDGVSDRQLGGNQVMGGPRGGKSMPLDAVKEYQVLLSPYDARYGDFAGLLVNAVTKSGTNELHGSAFGYFRNEDLARSSGFLGGSTYQRQQFGFTLGGPFVRDRMHFFIATEFQRHDEPATGPYIGQPPNDPIPVPVSPSDVERFASLLRAWGFDPGDGGRVMSVNPVAAFFGRLDVALPGWRSRLALRHTYSDVENTQFARSATTAFALSSNAYAMWTAKRSTAAQLFTQPSPRVFNELIIAHSVIPNGAAHYAYAPTVQVVVPNANRTGAATLVAGPPDQGQGTQVTNASVEIADHVTVQIHERHSVSAGVRSEWFHYYGRRVPGSFGRWMFPSLDSLARGEAASYQVSSDFGGASKPLDGVQLGAYVNDGWRAARGLAISIGLRADVLSFSARPEYNAAIDSVFGRQTTDFPGTRTTWSPRFGFSWEPRPDGSTRVRGGAGLFAGRPPLGWLRSPLRQYGTGVRALVCDGSAAGPKAVPDFTVDASFRPDACANGKPYRSGAVDLIDRNLRMAEALRASVAVDRELPWDIVATAEALYTRNRSDFQLVNMNLLGPQGVDRNGRVMYGTLRAITGVARPAPRVDSLSEVIDLRNHSRNYSWSVTGQLTKRFSSRFEGRASYTRSVMRDVQSLTENPGGNSVMQHWARSRATGGRHDDLEPGTSSLDLPHRVVFAATYAGPWTRWPTGVSVSYIGESGVRFTYVDSAASGLGDLNADGTNANDPIYVPRDAADTTEIMFTTPAGDVAEQQAAFERFIQGTPCLRSQRGRIVERNSCTAPWVHTSQLSLRQGLPAAWGHRLTLQLDIFNVLNLLNPQWGLVRVPNVNVLQHVGQTAGAPNVSQSVFRFNPTMQRYSTANAESSYQLQLAARYTF